MLLPRPTRAAYREARRVPRPGGRYLLGAHGGRQAANPFSEVVEGVIARFFPADPPGFYRVPFCGDPAVVTRELEAAAGQRRGTDPRAPEDRARSRGVRPGVGLRQPAYPRDPPARRRRSDALMQAVLAGLVERFGKDPMALPRRSVFFTGTAGLTASGFAFPGVRAL